MPVLGLGQVWGHLCLQVNEQLSDEFPFLILDRAALAITQILFRNRTIEERKTKNEDEFVRNLLSGRDFEQDGLQNYMPFQQVAICIQNSYHTAEDKETNFRKEEWEETKSNNR